MILAKVHESNKGEVIVALVDKDLKGKSFEEGDVFLDLTSDFYDGEELPTDTLNAKISKAGSINAVGKESTGFLIDSNFISVDDLKFVEKIPFIFILLK